MKPRCTPQFTQWHTAVLLNLVNGGNSMSGFTQHLSTLHVALITFPTSSYGKLLKLLNGSSTLLSNLLLTTYSILQVACHWNRETVQHAVCSCST